MPPESLACPLTEALEALEAATAIDLVRHVNRAARTDELAHRVPFAVYWPLVVNRYAELAVAVGAAGVEPYAKGGEEA